MRCFWKALPEAELNVRHVLESKEEQEDRVSERGFFYPLSKQNIKALSLEQQQAVVSDLCRVPHRGEIRKNALVLTTIKQKDEDAIRIFLKEFTPNELGWNLFHEAVACEWLEGLKILFEAPCLKPFLDSYRDKEPALGIFSGAIAKYLKEKSPTRLDCLRLFQNRFPQTFALEANRHPEGAALLKASKEQR